MYTFIYPRQCLYWAQRLVGPSNGLKQIIQIELRTLLRIPTGWRQTSWQTLVYFLWKNAVLIVMRPFLPTYDSVAAENVLINCIASYIVY